MTLPGVLVFLIFLSRGLSDDVSLPKNDKLIDLSWSFKNHSTMQWVEFRDFEMVYTMKGMRKLKGENMW